MLLHVTDFDGNIIDSFGNKNQAIVSAIHSRNKEEDSELLDITIATKEAEQFQEYRHILIQDENGLYRDFIINRSEKENNGYSLIEATASYLIEIGNSRSIPAGKYTKLTAKQALYEVLRGTGWEAGTVEWAGEKSMSWTSERTPYEMLKQLCTAYGLELDFTYEVDGKGVVKKLVHMYKKKALFNGKEIKKGKDLISLKRVSDATELNTALIALGPENDNGDRLRIEVVDDKAQEQFGLTKRYIWGIYEPESEDSSMTEARLRTLAKTELNKRKVIDVSYEVDALDIKKQFPHEVTRFGDMVRIKDPDFTPPLYAEAEVTGIEHDLVADVRTYTFGTPKEFKESDLRKYFNERLAMIQKQMKDNNTNVNTIIETVTSELDKVERKVHRGTEPPEQPTEGQFWFDTSNPQVAVLREYVNGEWVNSTAETVTQIGGLTREKIIYRELKQTYASVFSEHARLQTLYNDLVNSEYLVNLELKAELETVYNNVLNAFTDGSTKLENIEEETATIGALMEVQEALVIYRNHVQEFYIIVNDVQKSIDERLKFLQAQYTEEKFNEAMQGVATAIGGTYNEETGELIADIPNNDMLEEMRTTIEQSINDLTVENQAKLQELQDGITQTNQRITSTEEELSAGITSVTQKVDGLQVGGRNLALNSKSREPVNGSSNSKRVIYSLSKKLEVGKTYTLTYGLNVTSGNINGKSSILFTPNVSDRINVTLTPEKRNVYTFVATKESNEISIFFGTGYTDDNLNSNGNIVEVKLEEGNIATAWTPAPEDFKEVQVGGRNLITQSTQRYLSDKLSYSSGIVEIDGKKANVFNTSNNIIYLNGSNYTLEEGETYTFSFYAKATKPIGMTQGVYINSENKNFIKDTIFTTDWTRYSFTFVAVGNNKVGIHMYPIIKNADDTFESFYVTDWQLEKGNVATDVTPAPEDTDKQLSDIKTSVQEQSADINILKDGIKLKADNTEVTKIYDQYLTPLQTQVNAQQATLDILPSQISAKVSQSTYNTDMNNVITRLNSADSERTQLSNEIKDRVTLTEYNNMKVGTENLLLNSLYQDKSTSTSMTHSFFRYYLTTPLKVGKTYTFTGNFNTTDANQSGRASVRGYAPDNGLIDVDIVDGKISVTFEAKVASETFLVYKDVAGTSPHTLNVNVTNAMLVEGNKIGDYQQAPKEIDTKLTEMETSIEQNGKDIELKASKEEFNKTRETLSKTLAEIIVSTNKGVQLIYDENGNVSDFTVGPSGVSIDTNKLTIDAGDVTLKDGKFTVNQVNTKNVTIPRDDGGVPTILNGLDRQAGLVTGMEPMFSSTFGIGNNVFTSEVFSSGTWYGVFKRFARTSDQDYARVNAYYFLHTRRYLRIPYTVHVGTDADDKGNTPTGIYMDIQEFGNDGKYGNNRITYNQLTPTSAGGSTGIVNYEAVIDLGPPTGDRRQFYIHVKPNGEGIVGGSPGTDPRFWTKYSICKFAFRPFELYG